MANEQRMRPRKRKKVCAFCVDKLLALISIFPQLAVGIWTPTPR